MCIKSLRVCNENSKLIPALLISLALSLLAPKNFNLLAFLINLQAFSMMTMHHHAAGNDHRSRCLNPAAKPFLPLHENQRIPSSLQSFKPGKRDVAAPPFQPMLPQPHLPPVYGYYNQPCIGGYDNPVHVFVQPNQPQPGYHATNFYNPVIGPVPFSKPQFLGQDPCYQLGQPSMGFHSLNSGVPSASLSDNIVKQIEYYFSDENLPHDYYLISLMDDQGWVPISTVAKFKRVERMCTDIPFILDSLLFGSRLVEVQGNKIRKRRGGWSN